MNVSFSGIAKHMPLKNLYSLFLDIFNHYLNCHEDLMMFYNTIAQQCTIFLLGMICQVSGTSEYLLLQFEKERIAETGDTCLASCKSASCTAMMYHHPIIQLSSSFGCLYFFVFCGFATKENISKAHSQSHRAGTPLLTAGCSRTTEGHQE